MSNVAEIKAAIANLSEQELAAFRAWFREFDGMAWDRQFEADVRDGKLDHVASEALQELRHATDPSAR